MLKRLLPLAALLLPGCALSGGGQAPSASPAPTHSAAVSSPSPAGPQAVWVLSPIGLNLRETPEKTGKVLASIPQGTQLTASAFNPGDPGWYRVDYQGTTGWIAAKQLVSTHAQLPYGSLGAGYYFLYPATWVVTDRAADVQVDSPAAAGTSAPSAAPSGAPPAAPVGARLYIHEAADLAALNNVPTTPGSIQAQDQIEVYGITTIERRYTLAGGGYEADVKLQLDKTHSVLMTFRTPDAKDLAIFDEILWSFGVSLASSPSPSPSH
jgi:hypothetical protein